jgi:hypothetical protein
MEYWRADMRREATHKEADTTVRKADNTPTDESTNFSQPFPDSIEIAMISAKSKHPISLHYS